MIAGAASGPGAPSGGSSNSSLSSKSNDSSHPDNQGGSQSDWSEEEDIGTAPWSSRAPPELIASMSGVARKRQDLIHGKWKTLFFWCTLTLGKYEDGILVPARGCM